MQKYKILSSHFVYSPPGEYKEFYIGTEQKTNVEILDIYNQNKGHSNIDLILIEDLTDENEIKFNQEYNYAWFVQYSKGLYKFLCTASTATEYDDILSSYTGDISKMLFVKILKNELIGY